MEKGSALESPSVGGSSSGINGIAIGVMVIAVLLAALILMSVLKRNHSSASSSHYLMDESGHSRSLNPLVDDGRGTGTYARIESTKASFPNDSFGISGRALLNIYSYMVKSSCCFLFFSDQHEAIGAYLVSKQ